jgi:hypothetical protein
MDQENQGTVDESPGSERRRAMELPVGPLEKCEAALETSDLELFRNQVQQHNAAAMITHLIDKYDFDVNTDDSCGGLDNRTLGDFISGTPLHFAISCSNLPAVETLLKYGAEIRDDVWVAIDNKCAPALKMFLDSHIDPSDALDIAFLKDYIEGCKLCLEYGADVSIVEARGKESRIFGNIGD